MARNETEREDLLREAVGLDPRGELRCEGLSGLVTAGYRTGGALSLYFGQDPVYQFDGAGRLRRAFVEGLLFRSERGTLARLRRERTDDAVLLVRHDLEAGELAEFREQMLRRLGQLQRALELENFEVVRSVPDGQEAPDWRGLLLQNLQLINGADPWMAGPIVGRKLGKIG
jgi:hypothetical protein